MTQDKVNILIVDDLPEKLLVLRTVLEELDQNVVIAQSGPEALRQVMDKEFAVILLDVNMPNMDGYETAALIRGRRKSAHVPIIFVTAYADEVHTAHGYHLGAVDFILSPVVPQILRTKVKVFVDLFQMTQQIKRRAEEQVVLAREQAARSAAEESVHRLNFLSEASKVLASSLDLENTIRGVLGLIVNQPGDLGVIALLNEQRRLVQTEAAWLNPSPDQRLEYAVIDANWFHPAFAKTLESVIDSGTTASFLASAEEGMVIPMWNSAAEIGKCGIRDQDLKLLTVLPLVARGRAIGALCLAIENSPRRRGEPELALIVDLAHRAAIAIDNARLYRDIQEVDHRKNEFLAMLAHELRNPLAPLMNGIDILRLHGPRGDEIQQVQDMMGRQLHHLVRLVDDLLDISRITRDKIQLQQEWIDVAVVVDRAIEVSRPLLESRGHSFEVTLPAVPVRVYADPIRLAQVLSNLLNNAAKYTEKRGAIRLIVERSEDEVVFQLSDNGMGIPTDMLSSVFEPFTQVKRTLDRSQGGLGIGLALVRRLVELHGGTVQAASAGVNLGSEFVVRLPCRAVALREETSPPPARPTAKNGYHRILVVDDNVDVALSTAILLRSIGSEVCITHNGLDALAATATFHPDIVLLDIGLPEMNGYEVARLMRQQAGAEALMLVALSGYGQEEDRQHSMKAGFDYHLVKPASLAQIRSLLANSRVAKP